MLIINKERIEKSISRIKRLHTQAFKEKNINLIGYIEKLNKEVVLAVANFKCQNPKCSSEKELQIHHLVMRSARKFMDKWRYLSQRYWWSSQVVLCNDCHNEYHKEMGQDIGEHRLCIPEEKINRIKNKFLKS